jgi:thioredoxin reductase (NADPH)
MSSNLEVEVVVIGAGPIGIECSVNLKINQINHVLLDSHSLGNTILRWSDNTSFLSSGERLELAGIPLQNTTQMSPTGEQYLAYLRGITEFFKLPLKTFHKVTKCLNKGDFFELIVENLHNTMTIATSRIILATGAMRKPEKLGIPGEEFSFVHDSEQINHLYFGKKVLIIGDGNSALEKVIRIFRLGGFPTLLIQNNELDAALVRFEYLREWRLLHLKEKVVLINNALLKEIKPNGECIYEQSGKQLSLHFEFVIPCVGYDFDTTLLEEFQVKIHSGKMPEYNTNTMETNIKGVFLAGTIAGGKEKMHEFFIGTCHSHVEKIIQTIRPDAEIMTGSPRSRKYSFKYREVQFPPSEI